LSPGAVANLSKYLHTVIQYGKLVAQTKYIKGCLVTYRRSFKGTWSREPSWLECR
jgi:hypothetical protein